MNKKKIITIGARASLGCAVISLGWLILVNILYTLGVQPIGVISAPILPALEHPLFLGLISVILWRFFEKYREY